jgi:hypothetical protein
MKEIALHALDIIQNSLAAEASRLEVTLDIQGEAITLTVADNGRGMSPALLERVSDPFTTTRTTRKMGLGIPLLRMAAEQTGGWIRIESTLGVGTTLTARFYASHIDCPPVGDMGETICLVIQGAPELELFYTHRVDGRVFQFDTAQVRAQLGQDVSLALPEVTLWIREYLQEQEHDFMEKRG